MNFVNMLNASLNALSANKSRTMLTALGITIGIAAVISMVSAGQGAKSIIDGRFVSLGPNMIMCFSGRTTRTGLRVGGGDHGVFNRGDAESIREQLGPYINGCSEVSQKGMMLKSSNGSYGSVLSGGVPDVFRIRRWKFLFGGPYNEHHVAKKSKVAVIGKAVADNLFPNVNPVGKHFTAGSHRFRIIGVLSPKGPSLNGADQDNVVLVPVTTMLRTIMGTDKIQLIVTEARNSQLVPEVKRRVEAILAERHKVSPNEEPNYMIKTMKEYVALANTFSGIMEALIYAIASVSLLVGGIGVMNIMLVSVTERTREIGIRMAIGAKTRDILGQFLIESVILTLIGGGVGIMLGASLAWVFAYNYNWDFIITPSTIGIAVATSALVGIFFGFYPARKASMLDPIDALRYE